ncbi:MAG: RNA-binding protein [Frankiaceae bacterium]
MLEQALEHLVKGIVDHPDEVRVDARTRRGRGPRAGGGEKLLEVRVHPDDLGKIIGRQGRTAKALRTVMGAIGGKGVRVDLVDTDEIR